VNNAAFSKRLFTIATFTASVRDLFAHLDDLRAAVRQRRLSRAFAEKIMLTVTEVNGCRYCSYAHARLALKSGISEAELRQLLGGDFEYVPAYELVALTFSQHYAEQRDQFDASAWQRLVEAYDDQTARDILAYIRMITFANLIGNTFDAVLSRLAGQPAPHSRFREEIGVLMFASLLTIVSPFLVLTRWLISRLKPTRALSP